MELRPALRARLGSRLPAAALAAAALLVALPSAATAADLERPSSDAKAPKGWRMPAAEAERIADATAAVRSLRARHPRLRGTAYLEDGRRWQVSYVARGDELAQVHVDDRSGRVLEQWTGAQVAWRMARGYEGAFGRKVNAPYVWLPLCALFLLPFVDPRRPFRLLHLDLLVMLAFGASHWFFNRGEIGVSVPLAYPVLLYLLVRMLVAGFRGRERVGRVLPVVPPAAVAVLLVFLVGFRVGLNVADSNVIDVGYAGVIGADRIADGDSLYEGRFPESNSHGDTYGPANYLAYLPFEQALPWSGAWDDLPAAHGAALAFDLLTLLGLLLLGRRLRPGPEGRTLGLALAYAWAAYPYTLYVLCSNSNDSLVAMLVVFAMLALSSAPARGALVALAAAAKFAPLALAPLFAAGTRPRIRSMIGFGMVLVAVTVAAWGAFVPDGGPRELYERTLGYQAGRESPFSVWGQVESLGWLHTVVKAAAVLLALLVAFAPRRRTAVQVAALGAAVLIALQLAATHWFYLYLVWFAPLVFVALLAEWREPSRPPPATGAPEAARAHEREPALA